MSHAKVRPRHLAAVLAAVSLTAAAQAGSMQAQEPGRSPQMGALARMRWRELGPTNQAGRVSVFGRVALGGTHH